MPVAPQINLVRPTITETPEFNTKFKTKRKLSSISTRSDLSNSDSLQERLANSVTDFLKTNVEHPSTELVEGGKSSIKRATSKTAPNGFRATRIIHPYSNFRFLWDISSMILLLLNVVIIPYQLTFYTMTEIEYSWFLIFNILSDTWFIMDIFFNFRTGIIIDGPDSEIEMRPKYIFRNYMTLQQFGVDFISSCPFDVLLTIITYFDYQWGLFLLSNSDDFAYESSAGISSRYIKLLKVIKLLRFLRTYLSMMYVRLARGMSSCH